MRPLQPNNVLFVETSSGTYAPRLIVPQFVKSDARLSYANMVAAVYNSCDYNLMARFMKTYFRTDFTVVQELTGTFANCIRIVLSELNYLCIAQETSQSG